MKTSNISVFICPKPGDVVRGVGAIVPHMIGTLKDYSGDNTIVTYVLINLHTGNIVEKGEDLPRVLGSFFAGTAGYQVIKHVELNHTMY